MTQREQIFNILKSGQWICGQAFMQNYLPEYRSRINELRKSGHNIITRRCLTHKHNGLLQEWRLVEPNVLRTTVIPARSNEWCSQCKSWLTHSKTCPILIINQLF